MPALMAACESYLAATCFEDPEADPHWVRVACGGRGWLGAPYAATPPLCLSASARVAR
jgi:hypothetical protein